jgi:hypothetical protein
MAALDHPMMAMAVGVGTARIELVESIVPTLRIVQLVNGQLWHLPSSLRFWLRLLHHAGIRCNRRGWPLHPIQDRGPRFRSVDSVARKTADIATNRQGHTGRPTNSGAPGLVSVPVSFAVVQVRSLAPQRGGSWSGGDARRPGPDPIHKLGKRVGQSHDQGAVRLALSA